MSVRLTLLVQQSMRSSVQLLCHGDQMNEWMTAVVWCQLYKEQHTADGSDSCVDYVIAHLSNVRFPLAFRSSPASWRGNRTPGTSPPRYHSRWRWSAAGMRAESSWWTADGRPTGRGDAGDTRPLVDVNSCWSNGKFACISNQPATAPQYLSSMALSKY